MEPQDRDNQQEPAEPRIRSQPGPLRYEPDLPAALAIVNESSERPAKRPRQREKRVEIIDLTED